VKEGVGLGSARYFLKILFCPAAPLFFAFDKQATKIKWQPSKNRTYW
jgi:hypothetical protein